MANEFYAILSSGLLFDDIGISVSDRPSYLHMEGWFILLRNYE